MKRLFVLIVICFMLFAGCDKRPDSPANPPEKTNKFGTQAIKRPSSSAPDSKIIENDENENVSQSADIDVQVSDFVPDNSTMTDNADPSEKADVESPSSAVDSNTPESNKDSAAASQVDVEIKEKMFIAQLNDIYLNAEDYLGKTIKYEGIFNTYTWEEENLTYYSVIRYGPGCCGNDGNAGFEVTWDGNYPKQNDWVEAIGKLELYEEDGWQYLRLVLTSLTVLETRGAEYVSQ